MRGRMERREMGEQNILYYGVLLAGVFIGAVSQVMLKKAAMRQYSSPLRELLFMRCLAEGRAKR